MTTGTSSQGSLPLPPNQPTTTNPQGLWKSTANPSFTPNTPPQAFTDAYNMWVTWLKAGPGKTWPERDIHQEAMASARAELYQGQPPTVVTQPLPPPTNNNKPSLGRSGTGHLPAAARKNFLAQITPLAGDQLPEPRDLSAFWIEVEAAVEAIDAQVVLATLTPIDIQTLGPLIVGATGWSQVKHASMPDWGHFRSQVERVFGLTTDQLIEKFYSMRMEAGETAATFVLRVEAARNLRGVPSAQAFHVFSRRLPEDYQLRIDAMRPSLRATTGRAPSWDDVVAMARDDQTGAMLVPPDAKPPATASLQPVSQPSTKPPSQNHCSYCEEAGLTNTTHRREYCFIEPKSKAYRPDVRVKRLTDLQKRGVTIPQKILDDAPLPLNGAVMPGQYQSLQHALISTGRLGEDAVEAAINQMMDNDQAAAGGMVGHLTDGGTTVDGVHSVGNPSSGVSLLDDLLGHPHSLARPQGGASGVTALNQPQHAAQSLTERIRNLVAAKTDQIQATLDQAAQTKFRSLLPRRQDGSALGTIVNKLRITYPVLQASKVDSGMRQLVLAELVDQCNRDASSLVIPEGTRVQTVTRDRFNAYKEQLSGLTPQNIAEVKAKMRAQGFQWGTPMEPGEQVATVPGPLGQNGDATMTDQAAEAALREVAVQMSGMVSDMCQQLLPELVAAVAAQADPAGLIAAVGTTKPMPSWANTMKDLRSALVWDASQSICHIALDDVLTLGIVDTGASKSIISEGMAKQLGLSYEPAKEGNCGTFAVPGTAATNQYLGVVKDRIIVTFGEKCKFALTGLKIISHPCNLLLIGADLLCGGRPTGMWNFNGLHSSTAGANCQGWLVFEKEGDTEKCPLVNVPIHAPAEGSAFGTFDEIWEEMPTENNLDDQLRRWGIWEKGMTREQKECRYARFQGVEFGQAPAERWPDLRRQLLEIEDHLACKQDDVGCVQQQFVLELEREPKFFHKPVTLPPPQREWVKTEMSKLEASGVVKRVDQCKVASRIVLVPDGQSGQSYRMCIDFTDLNAYSKHRWYVMQESRPLIDGCAGYDLFILGDIKACFHNVPVSVGTQPYLGVVTQDGLFVCLRLPFGLQGAPGEVQALMDRTLSTVKGSAAFVDDVTIKGWQSDWEELWDRGMQAFRAMAHTGLMINLKKTKFLVAEAKLLGMEVMGGGYRLANKFMRGWEGICIPETLHDLQVLLGRFVWASPFIPGYKQAIQPLEQLLSSKSVPTWTEDCTEALNHLLELVYYRVKLTLPNFDQPFHLYPEAGEGLFSATLLQVQGDGPVLVAMVARKCTPTEAKKGPFEQLLMATVWACRHLKRYTLFSRGLFCYLPEVEMVRIVADREVHVRLRAYLLDMAFYNVVWRQGYTMFSQQGGMFDWTSLDYEKGDIQAPKLRHKEVEVKRPTTLAKLPKELKAGTYYTLHFDGGCRNKLGTGGWVLFNEQGSVLLAKSEWYADLRPTVNTAEMASLVSGLVATRQQVLKAGKELVVIGDSKLTIDFCTMAARPSNPELFMLLKEVRAAARGIKVHYRFTPRAGNALADWLTQVAREQQNSRWMTEYCIGCSPAQAPNCKPVEAFVLDTGECLVGAGDLKIPPKRMKRPGTKAKINHNPKPKASQAPADRFSSEDEVDEPILTTASTCNQCMGRGGDLLTCGGCQGTWHPRCITDQELPGGPFYCKQCRFYYRSNGVKDLTLDADLMRLVANKQLPTGVGEVERARLQRAASWLEWDRDQLWVTTGIRRIVPPVGIRERLVYEVAVSLGFPGGARLCELIKAKYYWANMKPQCVLWARKWLPNQVEGQKWKPPVHLHPLPKGNRPFHTWAIDLVTKLTPPGPGGETTMIVACDAFTKWVEAGPLASKSSAQTAKWLHSEIVCRYGVPAVIRCDLGREFLGDFAHYCTQMGIARSPVSRAHPRANGQVERYNGVIQAGFRKMATTCPGGSWWEFLPTILAGLRMLPTRLGFAPFVLVFKEGPAWLPTQSWEPKVMEQTGPPTATEEEQLVQAQVWWWDDQIQVVREALDKADQAMVRYYQGRADLSEVDLRDEFVAGDKVMVRTALPGKFSAKARGPYMFSRYVGANGLAAEIVDGKGKARREALANLRPYYGVPARKAGGGVEQGEAVRWHTGLDMECGEELDEWFSESDEDVG